MSFPSDMSILTSVIHTFNLTCSTDVSRLVHHPSVRLPYTL
jgi:hypothetical protein